MSNKKTESLARAVKTAALMFSERPYEEVSIAEIACRAHCSSATIYEAFETKKGLFRAARLQGLGVAWPLVSGETGPATLACLMDHLTNRVARLSRPVLHNFWRSSSIDAEHFRGHVQDSIDREGHLGALVDEVQRCMDAGLLRQGDPCSFAYVMLAGSGYEPVVYGLLFDRDTTRGAAAIMEAVLSPLVTDRGRAELAAYIDKLKPDNAPKTNEPSLLEYLRNSPRARVDPAPKIAERSASRQDREAAISH